MKHSVSIAVIAASLALVACKKDEAPAVEPEPAAAAPQAPAPEPAVEAEPEPTAEQIPIPEDFEEEARKEVTADTLRAQLDALEKEISPEDVAKPN